MCCKDKQYRRQQAYAYQSRGAPRARRCGGCHRGNGQRRGLIGTLIAAIRQRKEEKRAALIQPTGARSEFVPDRQETGVAEYTPFQDEKRDVIEVGEQERERKREKTGAVIPLPTYQDALKA